MSKKQAITLFFCTLLLTSCIETAQIDKIGIIDARGVDLLDDGLLETTVVIYQFSSESSPITRIRSGKGHTLQGALHDIEQTTSFKLTPGKIKVELFGKQATEKGILPYLDSLIRDARMADIMYLAISEPTAKEILSVEEAILSKDVGQYLFDLLENYTNDHNIPRRTVQDFLRIYYDVGQDNVLPIFELKEGVPKQKAIAVFQEDKYVGEITNEEAILINLTNRTVKVQSLQLSVPLELFKDHLEKKEKPNEKTRIHLAFEIEKGKNKTKLIDQENLIFQTKINMKIRLLEQSAGLIIKNKHVLKQLEKEVEKELETQLQELLTKLQQLNSDPFGYGRYYRIGQKGGKLTKDEWRDIFPSIKVEFNINAQLTNYGITE